MHTQKGKRYISHKCMNGPSNIQYVYLVRLSVVSSNNLLTMLFILFRENQYPASACESTTSSLWC